MNHYQHLGRVELYEEVLEVIRVMELKEIERGAK